MNWRNRQQRFDSDLQGLLAPQAQPKPYMGQIGQQTMPSAMPAIPSTTPKPLLLPPQGGPGGAFGPLQGQGQPPFMGQMPFGQPRSLPQTAAPQAQDNLGNWLSRMMQRSSGQQQMPGWRGGGNALAQGWRGR